MTTLATDIAKINADATTLHGIVHGPPGSTVATDNGPVPTLAEVLAQAGGGTIRGAWVTATAYALNDVVTYSGTGYRCILAHTSSAAFASDAAKWMVQTAALNVTNAQLADMATSTIKGRTTAGTGDPEDLTAAQAAAIVLPALVPSLAFGMSNQLINGNFDIWQRGTSFSLSTLTPTYTADRWWYQSGNASLAATITQQTATDPASGYAMRVQRNAGNAIANSLMVGQVIESVVAKKLAGKTCTLSFKAKCGANYSSAASVLYVVLSFGTGTDQGSASLVAGTWTGVTQSYPTKTISTSQQSFTASINVPAGTKEIAVGFLFNATGTAGANDWFEIEQVQFEEGSAASAFEKRPVGIEELLCARYLPAFGYDTADFIMGMCSGTTTAQIAFPFKVRPRVMPTGISLSSAGHFYLAPSAGIGAPITCTAIALLSGTSIAAGLNATVASGLTQGNATFIWPNSSSAKILFTGCEL